MNPRTTLTSTLALLAFGCAGGDAPPAPAAGVTFRDSAAIAIVEHAAGYEGSLPVWGVRSEPVLDIGEGEETGQQLDGVRGAVRLGDGRIVVANAGTSELRVFDTTGKYLYAIGRKGQGPGEFASLWMVWRLPGDTLVAMDNQLMRFSVFVPSGEFVRSSGGRVRSARGSVGASMRLLDGRFVGDETVFGDMKETSGPVRRVPSAVVVIDVRPDEFDTVVVVPGPEMYPSVAREGGQVFPTLRDLEFGRETVFTTDGTRIYVGTNQAADIRVYEANGRLVRVIRSATPAEPVTEEYRAQRIRENSAALERQRASEQTKAEWRKNQENPRFAESFPFYERLLIGRDGNLWVERARHTQDEGRRYIVYDSSVKAIATVKAPDRVRPYEVGPTEIIGLWRDPDEVNHVRVYRVNR